MSDTRHRLCLFGASPLTGNQGVTALCWSALEGLAGRVDADFRVFGYGANESDCKVPGATPALPYSLQGMSVGRRIWRADHIWRARCSGHAPWLRNPILSEVQKADAVLDVSGGDSFSDIYGASRFNDIITPKRLALRSGTPLILLPQTYGPFSNPRNKEVARDLVASANLAYARDADSFERMRELLGSRFDRQRHRPGVDLAFGLRSREPRTLDRRIERALDERTSRALVGLNISGLLANAPDAGREQFGLMADYPRLIENLVAELLSSTDSHILLVPHVHAPTGHYESDLDACQAVKRFATTRFGSEAGERVTVVTAPYDAMEVKWLIAQTDWFCGTRMHSTIAALSSGVATCALAYSLKTRGVFETCGAAEAIADLRHLSTQAALEQAMKTFDDRASLAADINAALPEVRARGSQQLDEIAASFGLAEAA